MMLLINKMKNNLMRCKRLYELLKLLLMRRCYQKVSA